MRLQFIALLFFLSYKVQGQDTLFARKKVNELSSERFWGRGYTRNGLHKSAEFLANQFKQYGLEPLNEKSFFQPFSYSVNTFPGKMKLIVNGKSLKPGADFIVGPASKGIKAAGQLHQQDSVLFVNTSMHLSLVLKNKLTWSVAQEQREFTFIEIDKKAIDAIPHTVKVDIKNKFISNFRTANVCGIVKGTLQPDSIVLITAHYDHLGGMGKRTYFPGANDNASGISLLLDLARYYALHPATYSIGFICFSGEEAGLIGSKYFTEHPLIKLNAIRFLMNLDLIGTGEEGITVVNATKFPKDYAVLKELNNTYQYINKIAPRGKAANSDHFWFTEKGIPSFFIYTNGGIKAYHDVYDQPATLPLTEYADLFKLIFKFNEAISN